MLAIKLLSTHASTLIDPGHIWVVSGSDPDCYPGQWVIRVSEVDPVSTLIASVSHQLSNTFRKTIITSHNNNIQTSGLV